VSQSQNDNDTDNLKRLLKLEIDRAADRLIKVYGHQAFALAAQKIDVARKKGDDADHIYWMQIAETVKRELPAKAS